MGNRVSGGMLAAQEGDSLRGGIPLGVIPLLQLLFLLWRQIENLTSYYDTDQPQYDHVDYPNTKYPITIL